MPRRGCSKNQGVSDPLGGKLGVVLGDGSAVLGQTSAVYAASLLEILPGSTSLWEKLCPHI